MFVFPSICKKGGEHKRRGICHVPLYFLTTVLHSLFDPLPEPPWRKEYHMIYHKCSPVTGSISDWLILLKVHITQFPAEQSLALLENLASVKSQGVSGNCNGCKSWPLRRLSKDNSRRIIKCSRESSDIWQNCVKHRLPCRRQST